jgi:Zn-dependent protease
MDLRLGSIPLRIRGSFFVMALLLGFGEGDPAKLVVWLGVVLVSVIVHELGHALTGKAFGLDPRIELHGMGGLTLFSGDRGEVSTTKSIAISVAGPAAGFLFAVVVVAAQAFGLHPAHPLARHALALLLWVNVAWGVFNLVPILPLDGGNVLRAAAKAMSPAHGERAARVVSIVFAGGIALFSIRSQQWWVLYLGVLYAFQNVQALRAAGRMRTDQSLAGVLQRAHAALGRGEAKEVVGLLRPAMAIHASPDLRQVGVEMFLRALVLDGSFGEAMRVIERERALLGPEELARWSVAMRELGRDDDANRIDELVTAPALSEFRA